MCPKGIVFGLVLFNVPLQAALFSEDFESYPEGTYLGDAGWTMSISDWGGAGYAQITRGSAFGPSTKAVDGATSGGRLGYIGAYRSFTQPIFDGQILSLSADIYGKVTQGANMARVGFWDGTIAGGGNGDPQGINISGTEDGWWLGQIDGASENFGPAITVSGIYHVNLVVEGNTDLFWASVTPPGGSTFTSAKLPLAGKYETDLAGVELYLKNFGGPVPDIDNINVIAVPEPVASAGVVALALGGWLAFRRRLAFSISG